MKILERDKGQFEKLNKSIEEVEKEQRIFTQGIPKLNVLKPATLGDGILTFDERQIKAYESFYDLNKSGKSIVKFVPASGAASRMFKALLGYIKDENLSSSEQKKVDNFFENMSKFAFYDQLQKGCSITSSSLLTKEDKKEILEYLLTEKGLSFANLPKGLIPFHLYGDASRTSIIEHLEEAVAYAKTEMKDVAMVTLHFTIQKEHQPLFEQEIKNYLKGKKMSYSYNIEYSIQDPSTNTLAVDENNDPFRMNNGDILFRPGGHGALLNNLNTIDADIIFIKNIDNVTTEEKRADTYLYKKALAGLFSSVQKEMKTFLLDLRSDESQKLIDEIIFFFEKKFSYRFPEPFESLTIQQKKSYLIERLNAPIRVAGMIENEGDPGGGPFYVKDKDGSVNLQILEQAQLDMSDESVVNLVSKSTYFSPVDIVCSTKTPLGEKNNLYNFRDENTYFISQKFYNGKILKALELPGLWNGSMAHWNTIFVRVPISTFTPVKELNDLLKPQHQSS